jgi:hypothetical protein
LSELPKDRLHARIADEKYNRRKLFFKNNNGAKLVAASRGTRMSALLSRWGFRR